VTLQNRVTPDGRIIADAARGLMMGNRGVLHDANRTLGRARWRHKNWVACRLEFKGRCRQVMTPARYTELFFLDEAVALAAGHRPCGECRHADYQHFKALWIDVLGTGAITASALDARLHGERAIAGRFEQRRHMAALDRLPDGAFVLMGDAPDVPQLVYGNRLLAYSPAGYVSARMRPARESVLALTPPSTLKVIAAGFRPALHPSAETLV
jgi:hypothetical protein